MDRFNWKNLTKENLERHYNPRVAVPDAQDYIDDFIERSIVAREKIHGIYDIRYGSKPKQTLDLHLPLGKKSPKLLVYIHGGYWRAIDKNDHSFVTLPYLKKGIAVANLNYDLCPTVTLSDIVEEITEAFLFIRDRSSEWGTLGTYLIGHSAGAHLAAEIIGKPIFEEEKKEFKLEGTILLSGIYEPEVVLGLDINQDIQLNEKMASECNVLRKPPLSKSPVMVCVGGDEPEGWIDQSRLYAKICSDQNLDVDFQIIEKANHFSLLDHSMNSDYGLNKSIIEFIEK